MTAAIAAVLLIAVAAFVGYWLGIWMLWRNDRRQSTYRDCLMSGIVQGGRRKP